MAVRDKREPQRRNKGAGAPEIDVRSTTPQDARFAVAGAFILFFIALEMILGITLYKEEDNNALTASIFPLAFPLIAGPGSLTTLLSLRAEFRIENIIIAVILNVVLIYIVLKTSAKIERFIGKNGISIIRKVFGVILLAIAVKLFTTNIKALL